MKKLWIIGWKDLRLAFRDRSALIFMLLAPFLLTLGLGLISGSFSGNSSGLNSIPVVIVNQDEGQLGEELVKLFESDDLADLLSVKVVDKAVTALAQVDNDEVAAAVVIPAGFTDSIIPEASEMLTGQTSGEIKQILIYSNPNMPTSSGVIQSIVKSFTQEVEKVRIGEKVAFSQIFANGILAQNDMALIQQLAAESQLENQKPENLILLNNQTTTSEAKDFNVLAYMAPGMALMFLMFTTSNGGRALLSEKNQGTLPRLLVSPTRSYQVLGGKVFGTFLTGTAQMLILIVSSGLLFNLQWGNPLAVLLLVLAAVFAAVGWGLLITAFAKTPGQVGTAGSALMLLFGILGGSFFSLANFPTWFQMVSKITPNAWGLDGFTRLASGGTLGDIVTPLCALLIMGAVLFAISIFVINRRNVMQA
jgi:ABC-2 type transport system permease protein